MLKLRVFLMFVLSLVALMLFLGVAQAFAQEETEEEKQDRLYREDYDRYQKVAAISDPVKRADQLLIFMKERPNSKMSQYCQENFLGVLDKLYQQGNHATNAVLADRFIKMRPKVGETYFFYAAAMQNSSKFSEAMDNLAKCYVVKNRLSTRAKELLDKMYSARNQGSLKGLDKIIKKAQDDMMK